MRVLMVSWEYPPKIVGGLGRHVEGLSEALVRAGHEVTVVTGDSPKLPEKQVVQGVEVLRALPHKPPGRDFVEEVMLLNFNMVERMVSELVGLSTAFDVVHVHDWLGAYAGKLFKHALRLPLIATIHATEFGRNGGLHNDLQRHISDLEWWLCYEAWQVIVCSRYMEGEVQHVFGLPRDKLKVIPNGIDPAKLLIRGHADPSEVRARFAHPDEKIVLFVGRLVREKGVWVMLDAFKDLLGVVPEAKLVVVGKGPEELYLRDYARRLGLEHKVYFTGFVDDETRNHLYHLCSVAVFPSLYEPFGIVALEAMALGKPVVVSDTGGLGEVVSHGLTGMKFPPGDSRALAGVLADILLDFNLAQNLAREGKREADLYTWDRVAKSTSDVYREVLRSAQASGWSARRELGGRSFEVSHYGRGNGNKA